MSLTPARPIRWLPPQSRLQPIFVHFYANDPASRSPAGRSS